MARYLEDRMNEESREECYWCEQVFPESELELVDDVLVCQQCRPKYEESLGDE
jgi:hypothetical protein